MKQGTKTRPINIGLSLTGLLIVSVGLYEAIQITEPSIQNWIVVGMAIAASSIFIYAIFVLMVRHKQSDKGQTVSTFKVYAVECSKCTAKNVAIQHIPKYCSTCGSDSLHIKTNGKPYSLYDSTTQTIVSWRN